MNVIATEEFLLINVLQIIQSDNNMVIIFLTFWVLSKQFFELTNLGFITFKLKISDSSSFLP